MANIQRNVFLISDSTGITLEKLSQSLLSQFPQVDFAVTTYRYIDTTSKFESLCEQIQRRCQQDPLKPLVFTSLLNQQHRRMVTTTGVIHFDVFDTFMDKLNLALELTPKPVAGLSHAVTDEQKYESRIAAINYALQSDDGLATERYEQADVILLGVSRTGKTPTCLYLAMNYGLFAANYPLTEEDWQKEKVPDAISKVREKCVGLTSDANQLARIRNQRRPGSEYASLVQCQRELKYANALFSEINIPCLDTGTTSIEELATSIISIKNLESRR